MQKRVFIIHGWEGNPENCWFPWLKKELENKGFSVITPSMPNPEAPEIKLWVGHLNNVVGEVDENTYFIGHSVGCQAILRYLESLENKKVGGVIFVAGWFHLKGIEEEEGTEEVARPWLETPIDFKKILKMTNKFTAIFSDDDNYVPIEDTEIFKEKLGAKIIIKHDKGHFSDDVGVKELPVVLEELLKIIG